MSDANPYRAPAAEIADVQADGELELAGIGHRFGAFVIDAAISAIIILSAAYATGTLNFVLDSEDSPSGGAEISALAFALFVILQSYLLKKFGQTIGKKIVGIRIVDQEGKLPGLRTLLYRRYLPIYLLDAVPVVGGILVIADFLFIFRADRRCLHDMLAGTRVVMHGAKHSSITWVIAPSVAVLCLSIAASVISSMPDAKPDKPKPQVKKAAQPPAAAKPPVQTASADGAASQPSALLPATPQPGGPQAASAPSAAKPAVAHPPVVIAQAGNAQAASTQAATPAALIAPEPVMTPSTRKKLRHCATLGSAAAIIRCSQDVR